MLVKFPATWSLHGLILFMLIGMLSGCGFQPIYGDLSAAGKPVVQELNRVAIASIPDRQGQVLRNRLIDRFYHDGRPKDPAYNLAVSLRSTEIDLAIQKDATATRRQLDLFADYVLTDRAGKELQKGTAHSIVSYNKLAAQYGTLASRENATDRALQEVGEQIANRVSLFFAGAKTPEP